MKKIYSLIIATLFVFSCNAQVTRQWATYYGDTGQEPEYPNGSSIDCATDASGNVYLAGSTNSTSGIASLGYQNSNGGGYDAFLVKFDATGVRLWATYFGGTGNDFALGVATDPSGNVYLCGGTVS